ncbi:MAG TPA: hypothetical protein EYN54_09400 [Methylococcaceae bacterium]|nr:hypothetical protein [Methylococcaceae bacterium]
MNTITDCCCDCCGHNWKCEVSIAQTMACPGCGDKPEPVKAKPLQPIFTKAMKENNELPQKGMDFIINYHEHLSRYNDMDGLVATVISVSDCGVITFNTSAGLGALRLPVSKCKVIEPPIELIDGKAYQFTNENATIEQGVYYEGILINQHGNTALMLCTNIKPLTLEVKS